MSHESRSLGVRRFAGGGSRCSVLGVRLVARPREDPETVGKIAAQALRKPIVPLDQDLQVVDVVDGSARVDTQARQSHLDPVALLWRPCALLPRLRRCWALNLVLHSPLPFRLVVVPWFG